jgi:hydrogenase maturation protease
LAARVIGIGQAMAGDDGAGVAAARRVRELSAGIEIVEVAEPSALIPLLRDGADPVVLIDAVVDTGAPGRVLHLEPGMQSRRAKLLSSHGVAVMDAIELARILDPPRGAPRIEIIGITIGRHTRHGDALSAPVAAAVEAAARAAVRLAGV